MALSYWDRTYAQYCYQFLKNFYNDIGVSAIMGNLYAESAICPFRCQSQGFNQSWNTTLTFRQNNEDYFVNYTTGGGGYSLAQWTYKPRKRKYYQYCTQGLIGDNNKSIEFVEYEMRTDYAGVYSRTATATNIDRATVDIMKNYENPADQSAAAQARRISYAKQVYNDFSGLPPIPPGPQIPIFELFKFDDHKKRPLPFNPNWLI